MTMPTKREIKRLEYNHPFPKELGGKRKVFEEVFVNSGGEVTPQLAEYHLSKIRKCHPESSGWYTEPGHEGVCKGDDGLFYAYRHHAQYH